MSSEHDAAEASMSALIVTFVEKTLIDEQPAEDVATADTLGAQLLSLLDNADDWGAARDRVAGGVAAAFAGRPEAWLRIVELFRTYLRSRYVASHARANRSVQRTVSGVVESPVTFELLPPFIATVMRAASPEERAKLYAATDSNEIWALLAGALEDDASKEAVVTFLRAYDANTNVLYGDTASALERWSRRNVEASMALVDEWVRGELVGVGANAILLLTETVATDPTKEPWRSSVVRALNARVDLRAWELAAMVECFASPHDVSTATRHARLLECVARAPPRLMAVGLRALLRDARNNPTQTLSSLRRLLDLAESAGAMQHDAHDRRVAVADVVHAVLQGLRSHGDNPDPIAAFFPEIVVIEPRSAHDTSGLDMLLSDLLGDREALVKATFTMWLEAQAERLVSLHRPLEELLSLLAHKLGPTKEERWLVDLLIRGSQRSRKAAEALLAARNRGLSDASLDAIDEADARILLHELAGTACLAAEIAPTLFRLARACRAVLPEVEKVVTDEVITNYPGATEQGLPLLRDDPIFRAAHDNIKAALERRKDVHAIKIAIPEIVQLMPALRTWALAQQRETDRAMNGARERSVFAMLTTTVPIGRGKGSVTAMGPHSTTSLFEEHAFSMEMPARDFIDPVHAYLLRLDHLMRAEQLRQGLNEIPR